MTPAARLAAAIDILDEIRGGAAAELALTGWARSHRFAGSKDRAAIRDLTFEALRRYRSYAALGGGDSGRALMIGHLRQTDQDLDQYFGGQGYGPTALSPAERSAGQAPAPGAEAGDIPDWLWPIWCRSLEADADAVARALQSRADVHLRVNLARVSRDEARLLLEAEGIRTSAHSAATSALIVEDGARRIRLSKAFQQGLVELQDAASQAIAESLDLRAGMRVLDYCAGGGGKTLAMAAQAEIDIVAHDVNHKRMRDLPDRAARAGIQVTVAKTDDLRDMAPFDLVLCDAPCSGSGSWRRDPEGKWRLTENRLDDLVKLQTSILKAAKDFTATGGQLAYATCSLLDVENDPQVNDFIKEDNAFSLVKTMRWSPLRHTDGFFFASMTRA